MTATTSATNAESANRQIAESVTVRFCGDSGDGMQLAGTQFTNTSSIFGNDVATLPDFPAEIRAPAGSIPGVSGFQINFSSRDIHTPGDEVDALIAMNPAALVSNYKDVIAGGIVVVNEDAFKQTNFDKAHLETEPARGRHARWLSRLSRTDGEAHRGSRGRLRPDHQGGQPLQELLRTGHRLLAV
jgi:2-oxoglutarate ferredoxin oxidoreductase subunit alpha